MAAIPLVVPWPRYSACQLTGMVYWHTEMNQLCQEHGMFTQISFRLLQRQWQEKLYWKHLRLL